MLGTWFGFRTIYTIITLHAILTFSLANWLGIEGKAAEDGGRRTFDDFPHQGNLSPALIQYFSSGTNAIISDSNELTKVGFIVCV